MNKTVTREDIAKLVNVSPTIISYVLSNSNYVSQEKRKKVLEVVRQLNYILNQLAGGLRTNRSAQFVSVRDSIRVELFEAAGTRFFERGCYTPLDYSRNTKEFPDMLINRQPEGTLMTTSMFDTRQLNSIAMSGIFIILYGAKHYEELDPKIVTVVSDYHDAVRKSVDYLILKGHTCIGMASPVKYLTKGVRGGDFRIRTYVEVLRRNSTPVRPGLMRARTQTVDGICEEVSRVLVSSEKDGKPMALVIGNDYLAAQIMQYLKKLNISVPGDLSVIGCDNTQIAPLATPVLTTVDVSKGKLAKTYVDRMLASIEGQQAEDRYIGVKFIIRESA